ncbi:hypothetical protein WA577_007795 [Blastocystis sp. JDR]
MHSRVHLSELLIAVRNVMFAEEQSDVQEFFLYLVEELAKEVESFAPSVEAVPIEDEDAWSEIGSGGRKVIIHEAIVKQNIVNSLFETQLRKESRSYSKRQLVEQQSFLTLSLPIASSSIESVGDALSLFLSGSYDSKQGAYRIEQSPPCLVIQLMRFIYSRKLQRPVKIQKPVAFEQELDLSDYDLFDTAKYAEYELFGVIAHQGTELMKGHYVSYCRVSEGFDGWVCCNDQWVREVSYQEVLHAEPYMLFYRAVK